MQDALHWRSVLALSCTTHHPDQIGHNITSLELWSHFEIVARALLSRRPKISLLTPDARLVVVRREALALDHPLKVPQQ